MMDRFVVDEGDYVTKDNPPVLIGSGKSGSMYKTVKDGQASPQFRMSKIIVNHDDQKYIQSAIIIFGAVLLWGR